MFTDGFINIHRKILEWEWYQDIPVCRVFVHLILTANWTEQKWQGITVKAGQRITSIEHLADDTNLSVQQVRTALKKLKSTGEISIKATNKFSIITIENYEFYQNVDEKITNKQQTNNKQVTNNQQQYNKDNKDNKDNNKLNYIKLNYLYLFLIKKRKKYEKLTEIDRESIVFILKNLELYIEDLDKLPDTVKEETEIKCYALTQIYLSPYKIYLDKMNIKLLNFNYLQAKKYCNTEDLEEFMNYFIVCLRKDLEKNK